MRIKLFAAAFMFVFALAQSLPAAAQEEVAITPEAGTLAEADLVVSNEAAEELTVDLPAELGLADYDPVVPDGLVNNLVYTAKEIGRDVQEAAYNVFASDEAHAELVQDHANKEMVEAAKLYEEDPSRGEEVVDILDEYQQDLTQMGAIIPELKGDNPEFAKQLSLDLASDHLFVVPPVLDAIADGVETQDPSTLPDLERIGAEAVKAAGEAVIGAADNGQEIADTLNSLAGDKARTPFSGFAHAEILGRAKEQLEGEVPPEIRSAFEEAITGRLAAVEKNLQALPGKDEAAAEQFKNFVTQLPGQGLGRMKMMDQFKSQTKLPPVFLEKFSESQAKLAQFIVGKIENIQEEEIRKAATKAMMDFRNPGVDDIKILTQFSDLVPQEELRAEITKNRDQHIQKFVDRFGDDKNAQSVTEEFKALTGKVESGELAPDANFFKSLEDLKGRLSPDQQKFITDMESAGKQEMFERIQNDENFVQRFSTFNPADNGVLDRIREGIIAGEGLPAGVNWEAKFEEIKKSQTENFREFLNFQNRPEDVQEIQKRFESEVPEEIRQEIQKNFGFDPDSEFKKHEEFAREKEQFFKEKFEETRKEFEEKFGGSEIPSQLPGRPGFSIPEQRAQPTPFDRPDAGEQGTSVGGGFRPEPGNFEPKPEFRDNFQPQPGDFQPKPESDFRPAPEGSFTPSPSGGEAPKPTSMLFEPIVLGASTDSLLGVFSALLGF